MPTPTSSSSRRWRPAGGADMLRRDKACPPEGRFGRRRASPPRDPRHPGPARPFGDARPSARHGSRRAAVRSRLQESLPAREAAAWFNRADPRPPSGRRRPVHPDVDPRPPLRPVRLRHRRRTCRRPLAPRLRASRHRAQEADRTRLRGAQPAGADRRVLGGRDGSAPRGSDRARPRWTSTRPASPRPRSASRGAALAPPAVPRSAPPPRQPTRADRAVLRPGVEARSGPGQTALLPPPRPEIRRRAAPRLTPGSAPERGDDRGERLRDITVELVRPRRRRSCVGPTVTSATWPPAASVSSPAGRRPDRPPGDVPTQIIRSAEPGQRAGPLDRGRREASRRTGSHRA